MNDKHSLAALIFAAATVAGCSAGTGSHVPVTVTAVVHQTRTTLVPGSGKFIEYPMPSGADPVVFSKGPYNTLWFNTNIGNVFANGFNVYRFSETTGNVATFTYPSPWSVETNIYTANSLMYFVALNPYGQGYNPAYLSYATSSGTIVIGTNQVASDEIMGTMVQGPDGDLWFPDCLEACTEYPGGNYVRSITLAGGSGVTVQLPNYNASELTPGPLGYMYVTASYTPAVPPPPHPPGKVFVLSTSGAIVHVFKLPVNSAPSGIATGPDHNLWIAEPGIGKIARMTPTGTVTQFTVPTANAGAAWITGGADGAMWFTETNANKIGRITMSGGFREWSIPAANAGASYITYCYPGCGPHYGVWFSETNANNIAQFDSPI